jgi:PAS domain S-box-containing protein
MVAVGLLGVAFFAETEGAAVGLLLTAIVALTATTMGSGPWLLVPGALSVRINAVQIFLSALTVGIIPTAAAITERRRLQDSLSIALDETRRTADALRESEELYRLLAENASDIVIRTDVTGRILYLAPSVDRILGYAPSELIGTLIYDLLLAEDAPTLRGATSDALQGRHVSGQRIEYRARHGSGRVVWLESSPTVGQDSNGLVGIVDIARDVTERKAMEEALIEAWEQAEAAAEAKSEFLANVSHELKTPLTSVIGFADALNDYCQLDEQARRFANRVRTASLALLTTVNDILDYSRLESGLLSFEAQLFPLRKHVEEALDMFEMQAAEKGIELRLECASSLDVAEVFVDPQRLRQVLLNLVGNAVKFTDSGSVALVVAYEERSAKGPYLRCEVVDTGPGIDPAYVDQLFRRFSQVDNSNHRRFGGTGLGLAICKGIVSAMGGDIGVSTELGRGARFWFEVPVQMTDAFADDLSAIA